MGENGPESQWLMQSDRDRPRRAAVPQVGQAFADAGINTPLGRTCGFVLPHCGTRVIGVGSLECRTDVGSLYCCFCVFRGFTSTTELQKECFDPS